MRKIPTLYIRDPNNMARVTDKVHPDCHWVFRGEGTPTRKIDGTCCLVEGGKLYKRREVKKGKGPPPDFREVDHDEKTGKRVGWVPVGDGKDDRWHREAFVGAGVFDGTYELVGPKVQGNPYGLQRHVLVAHNVEGLGIGHAVDPHWAELEDFLRTLKAEGIVWHHPDGRMAKIKRRDFGLPWPVAAAENNQ